MGSNLQFDQTTMDWMILLCHEYDMRTRHEPLRSRTDARAIYPSCPGHEALASHEIYVERPASGLDREWFSRVVPNKFPALQVEKQPLHHVDSHGFHSLRGGRSPRSHH